MGSCAKKLQTVKRIGVNLHLFQSPRNNNKNLVLKQFKKRVTIMKYKIYLLVLVEIISCYIAVNRNTSDGFPRKERREMIRPKAGVLEISKAYEMVRERKIPHMFGGGGF